MANTNKGFAASYGRRPWLGLKVINDCVENLIQLTSSKDSLSATEMFEFFFFKLEKKFVRIYLMHPVCESPILDGKYLTAQILIVPQILD